jgi:HSP20 family protein
MSKERENAQARERESAQANKDDQRLARRESRENVLPSLGIPSSLGMPLLTPFGIMRRFMEEFDRAASGTESAWNPALEVFERDGKVVVRADVPGLDKDQVKIEVVDNQLVISGERNRSNEERREGFYRSERSYGSFCRMIELPEGVDAEQALATFDNGVLEITMPAPQRSQPKRIEIRNRSQEQTQTSAPQQQSSAAQADAAPAH